MRARQGKNLSITFKMRLAVIVMLG